MDIDNEQPKRKRGRPRKTDVVSKSKGSRGAVGRPKGDSAIINEYKARMLASPKSRKVLDAIFDAALDDEHKNQAAAWKLVMDRMLPLSYFEKDSASGRSAVSITISGIGSGSVETDVTPNDPIEGEYTQDV
jgi:hypothetical protein|tara:strand:- start:346 stop:741 length:396 start_codon:yes stop_codon:yes gene_type:complete